MAHSLEGCVSSLRESLSLLNSSIATLDAGVNDFPRLAKVLQTTRHFELISEPDLLNAQSSLLSEIEPEIDSLLERVSTHLDKLERREQALMAKCELHEGRLSSGSGLFKSQQHNLPDLEKSEDRKLGALDVLKMAQLRKKKERLVYAIDRLQLQAHQRERQLRRSMAAPGLLE